MYKSHLAAAISTCLSVLLPATTLAATFLGTDDMTDGSWVGAYGSDGYVLCNFNGAVTTVNDPPLDLVDLPAYISGIDYSTGTKGYRWANGDISTANRVQAPTDENDRRATIAFGDEWTATLNFNAARQVDVSVYFLQKDVEARVQAYTINGDAASSQTTVGSPTPESPRWYTWRVVGSPSNPVTINSKYLGGSGGNAVIGAIAIDPVVASDLLLSDSFNNAEPAVTYSGGDYGLNQELNMQQRQLGSLRRAGYDTGPGVAADYQVNSATAPGKLAMSSSSRGRWAVLAQDLPADIEATVTIDPATGETTGSHWAMLSVRGDGESLDNSNPLTATNSGVDLLIRSNGEWYVGVGGSFVPGATGYITAADEYTLDAFVVGDQYWATINGQLIDANGSAAGTTLTLTDAAVLGSTNYVTLSMYTNGGLIQTTFDNLTIMQIPEPGTLWLLCLGGLILVSRRRRARPPS